MANLRDAAITVTCILICVLAIISTILWGGYLADARNGVYRHPDGSVSITVDVPMKPFDNYDQAETIEFLNDLQRIIDELLEELE